jgi:hypothetical protein
MDGWQMDSNVAEGVLIPQAVTFQERVLAAERCADALDLTIPTLLDGMDDAALKASPDGPSGSSSSMRIIVRGTVEVRVPTSSSLTRRVPRWSSFWFRRNRCLPAARGRSADHEEG